MAAKILVLGSNSFSGASFSDFALSKGAEVYGISRSPEPSKIFLPYKANTRAHHFHFSQIDINHDFEKLIALIESIRPEFIVDFAGQGMVAPSWKDPEAWYRTNFISKVKLHERLRAFDFLQLYLRFSTPEVYGSTENNVKESAPLWPSTPYAVSHAAIDLSLRAMHRQYGFPVVLTRASNVYGPGQQLYRIIPKTIICGCTGNKLALDGGGHAVRNFVHIQDVNRALWKIWERKPVGEVFHLAGALSDEYVSIRRVVELLSEMLAVPFSDLVTIVEDRPGKDRAYLLSVDKARDELDWQTQIPLEAGLREVVGWVKENLIEIKDLPWEYLHKL